MNMDPINKDLIFQEIPLFSGLKGKDIDYIKERSGIANFKKGEVIYEEGSPGAAFYCIVSGRVSVFTHDSKGNETVLEYLHHGKYFGIISLLTGETHSVTARAVNDCTILVINKDDFKLILEKIPSLAIHFSHTLSRRLKNKDIHQKIVFESKVISVFSSYSQAGKSIYALNLAFSLQHETRKRLIILDVCPKDRLHSLPKRLDITGDYGVFDLSLDSENLGRIQDFIIKDKFGIDVAFFTYNIEDASCVRRLVEIFTLLVNDYNYIILDLPSSMDHFVFHVLNQSDSIHTLTSPEPVDLKRTRSLIERLKDDFNFQESKIKVIINEYKFAKVSPDEQVEILGYSIFATLPKVEFKTGDRMIIDDPGCEYSRVIRRISRQEGDALVGLALGVGFAYGFCHIGVLKVIEEEHIPIDVITGTSMGSLIASLWAIGKSADEILSITQEFHDPRYVWSLVDLTFPVIGFIKGNKLYNLLKKYFGHKTFYDTRLPLKIIASDIKKKEPRVIEKGLLLDAIMASCSMPGVFWPFRFKGELLFDGGVVHPLPTEPLISMGVKKIIAVNVTPSKEDVIKYRRSLEKQLADTYAAVKKRRWFDLRSYLKDQFKTNILDSIFSSFEMMQSELAQKEALLADVVLHPDTQGMHWLELGRAKEFFLRGEAEARSNLDKIFKMIND